MARGFPGCRNIVRGAGLLLSILAGWAPAAEVVDSGNGLLVFRDSVKTLPVTEVRNEGIRTWNQRCMTVAREHTSPTGVTIAKGSEICFDEEGFVVRATVANEWTNPKSGFTAAAGKDITHYRNSDGGGVKQVWLARDWREPMADGRVFKGGTRLEADTKGRWVRFTLAERWRDPRLGMVLAPDEEYWQGPPGTAVSQEPGWLVLAEAWTHPVLRFTMAAGQTVRFVIRDDVIRFRSFTLAKDWTEPTWGIGMQAGTKLEYHANGGLASFTLAADFQMPQPGPLLKHGTVVNLKENGDLRSATLAAPWTDRRTGRQHAAGETVAF